MKKKIGKLTVCALILAAIAVLSGCGSKKVSEGYWVLSEVTEDGETVKGDDLEEYCLEGSYIVTEDEEYGYAVLFGIPADFEINADKGTFAFETGSVGYELSGRKLTLADSNVTMVFEKSKKDAPKKPKEVALASYDPDAPQSSSDDTGSLWGDDIGSFWDEDDETDSGDDRDDDNGGSDGSLSYSDPREFFEGDWYGWMQIDARTEFWEQIDGEVYDAVCRVEMEDDEHATVTIWDSYSSYEEPFAQVECLVSSMGSDPKKGLMYSDSEGFFLDGNFNDNSWVIDPGSFEWSNYMMIASTYVDGDGVDAMDYVFHFKKWGDDWSDFSQKPPMFDWYKKLIDAGEPMPEKIPES